MLCLLLLIMILLLYVMYTIYTVMSCSVALSDDVLCVTITTEFPHNGLDSWDTFVIRTAPPRMWSGWPCDSST